MKYVHNPTYVAYFIHMNAEKKKILHKESSRSTAWELIPFVSLELARVKPN